MSVEIRRATEGHCECPGPHPMGFHWECRHWWECDWGRFDNMEADPRRGLGHLMVITGEYVHQLLVGGPQERIDRGITSATAVGERIFVHLDYGGQHTTWELFGAHFWDGEGLGDIMVGRWPD